jgi:hypothetical protein
MRPKLLFPEYWDRSAFSTVPALAHDFELIDQGFDLFRFPENARIPWLDARRYVERLARN